jgi:exodeoxyribonuclease VII large subunit
VLNRGYAVVERAEGGLVRSVTEVAPGAAIRVRLSDGRFDAQVGTVHPDEKPEAPLDGAG